MVLWSRCPVVLWSCGPVVLWSIVSILPRVGTSQNRCSSGVSWTGVLRGERRGSVLAKSCVARGKSDIGLAERVSLQRKATQVWPKGCRSRRKQRRIFSNGGSFSPNRCRSRKDRHRFGPMDVAPEKSDTGFTKRVSLQKKAISLLGSVPADSLHFQGGTGGGISSHSVSGGVPPVVG